MSSHARPTVLVITQSAHGQRNHVKLGRLPGLLDIMGFSSEFVCPREQQALPRDPKRFAAVYVDGGMFSANSTSKLPWLNEILKLIEKCLHANVPLLGVCLGASLIARALGADVKPHHSGEGELGYRVVEPVEPSNFIVPTQMLAYMWHQEGADLPLGTRLLGKSRLFNQAFQYGDQVFGLQFHPEATTKIIRRWLLVADRTKITFPGADSPEKQMADSHLYDQKMHDWFAVFLIEWLKTKRELV